MIPQVLADIPALGSGLGYRAEIGDHIMNARADIDVVEIISEQYAGNQARIDWLKKLADSYPLIPHGLGLSVGTPGPVSREQLVAIRQVSEATRAPYYSDHLCVTQAPGIDLGHLMPLWYRTEVLTATIERVNTVQDFIGKPLVLENITYSFPIPNGQMPETEFFHRLTEATGCGILFDLTNLYTNSVNHHFDPVDFMEEMPLGSVVQVHLAGGKWHGQKLFDSHSEPVPEAVWMLFSRLCRKADVKGVILEQDTNLGDFGALIRQVKRARSILRDDEARSSRELT
ncbi:MAG TPA: DUF692 domain-containing protein [Streptosporangiaceae bacterium]